MNNKFQVDYILGSAVHGFMLRPTLLFVLDIRKRPTDDRAVGFRSKLVFSRPDEVTFQKVWLGQLSGLTISSASSEASDDLTETSISFNEGGLLKVVSGQVTWFSW
jgi:hypothetical protein